MNQLSEQIMRVKCLYMASDNKALKRLIGAIMAGDNILTEDDQGKKDKNISIKRDPPIVEN